MIASAMDHVKAGKLLELYKRSFEEKFGQSPMINVGEAMEILKWLVSNFTYERTESLIPSYFRIEDDWIKGQGYSLEYFRNNINKVIALSGNKNSSEKQVYVVFYTESGYPVTSHNPNQYAEQTPFKPMLWDDWVKASVVDKLQFPQKAWEATGNDIFMWIQNWFNQGWLEKEVREIAPRALQEGDIQSRY